MAFEWIGPCRLCETEVDRIPVGLVGVYVLQLYDRGWGAYPAFYVGKTTDLRRRLHEHSDRSAKPRIGLLRDSGPSYFSFLAVEDVLLLDRVEGTLIRLLKPPCNDQVPTAQLYLVPPPPIVTPFARLYQRTSH